ncbi:PQQ-binding-like beta-propeller repeat protein [Micromonospora sp. NPDC000316]|uniref:outer membrane protein assembly factor BamB family protein n=1 Tax=Micromonospora sp. NPDC000316 TaxID=3364216 RepID=UPI0036AB1CDD
MSIIELGEVRDEPASTPPPRRPRAAGRPLRSTAVLLLTLAVLTAAAPVPRRTVTSVPTAPGASAYLVEDGIVVVDPSTPDGDRYLTSYTRPASTGDRSVRRRWQVPLARSGDYLAVWAERGLLLAAAANAADGVLETTAFDAETGQRRWQHRGLVQWTTDGGLLLANDSGDGPGTVRRVAPDTGRVLWSLPIPPGSPDYHNRAGGVDQVVFVQPTGEVQVYDAGTGDLLRSVDTLPGDRSAFQRVQVVGDLVLLVPPGSTRLVAYGLPGMDPLWTAPVPLVAWVTVCADLLCTVQQTGEIQAIDPATGAVRWSDAGPDTLADVRQDKLLVTGPDQRYAVRDAKTGRERTDLGQWGLVSRLRRDDDLIGVRPAAGGRLVVAELDLAAGRARILDVLPGVVGGCQAAPPVLLCRRLDGSTALWRLPR